MYDRIYRKGGRLPMLLRLITVFAISSLGAAQAAETALSQNPELHTVFDQVWQAIEARSPALKGAGASAQASQIRSDRMDRHFYPKLMMGAQVFSTNDPGNVLFSTLGSRSAASTDFVPAALNQPNRDWFQRVHLTANWSIFEGGAQTKMASATEAEARSQSLASDLKRKEVYSQAVALVASWWSLKQEQMQIQALKNTLSQSLARYGIASPQNPVGYSGWLGMKSLVQKLEIQLEQSQAEIISTEKQIEIQSGLALSDLAPRIKDSNQTVHDTAQFAEASLGGAQTRVVSVVAPSEVEHWAQTAQAEWSQVEKSRWLPKLGLFASQNWTGSPRQWGNALEYGAYLQWELFNPQLIGIQGEATAFKDAARFRAQAQTESETSDLETAKSRIAAAKKNLVRIQESLKITDEQIKVTEKLYRNGSITALAWVEILSRRADVIENRRKLETQYAQLLSQQYLQKGNRP
jgi:hypothetical protein